MKTQKRVIFSALLGMLLVTVTACGQQIPPLNFTVPNAGLSEHPVDAELRSITVSIARPDEQTGRIDWRSAEGTAATALVGSGRTITDSWREALIEALNRTLIFRDGGSKTVNLSVKITELEVPEMGISFTSTASARYEIIDRSTGDIIFAQDIASRGTTPFDYAYLGIARQRESVNRAVQNNISLFLQAAETIDVKRPMFPAPGG